MDRWGSQYPEDLHLIEDLGLLILGTKETKITTFLIGDTCLVLQIPC